MLMWLYRAAALLIGYLLAAGVSANVSVAFAATVWGSVWTWIVLVFWVTVTYLSLWLWPFAIAGLGMLTALLGFTGLVAVAEKWSDWSLARKRKKYRKGRS